MEKEKVNSEFLIRPCPFCGNKTVEIREDAKHTNDGYSSIYWLFAECQNCGVRTKNMIYRTLAEFTNHTVEDFRNNPILRAKVEDEYEEYITSVKAAIISDWNTRYGM